MSRAIADAIAMIDLHHDSDRHARHRPRQTLTGKLFDEMERTRCESLGALQFAGIASNLHCFWTQLAPAASYSMPPAQLLCAAMASLTRRALGVDWPIPAALAGLACQLQENTRGADLWPQLVDAMHQQTRYARLCLQIIASLPGDTALLTGTGQGEVDSANEDDQAADQQDDQTSESDQSEEQASATIKINLDLRQAPDPEQDPQSSDDDQTPDDMSGVNRDAPVQDGETIAAGASGTATYQIYSTTLDEVVTADTLCGAAELLDLRATLDEQIERHARVVNVLAGKLQRLLMAQQQRHWIFDLEEGQLDTSQLTRVVTRPRTALSFKQESDIKFRDTTVTLLVDNSRSMLGKPIAIAAACADLLAQTLERCGVTVEILGFTTTELHGGPNAERWQHAGGRINPGRLNALRHIIYKPASAPYRRARRGIGAMLQSELLKQNIDGEALLWANQRLQRRSAQRKILMVISDGAPLDTSTMAANQQNILVQHLHQVIADIEKRASTELVAIGIGHDVSQFYQRATNIYDSRQLGRAMLSQLTQLFSAGR